MSFSIIATEKFRKELKTLDKKFKSIKAEYANLLFELDKNPTLGTYIGQGCYKIRLAIKSKGKGKRGGARVVTYVYVSGETVFLLSIFDKSDKATITDSELQELLKQIKN